MEVSKELDASMFGIICLTRDNLNAPWLLFESGALSKKRETAVVCPYILDVELSSITGPLSQFQAKKADKSSTFELLHAINTKLSKSLENSRLEMVFELLWPALEKRLREIPPDTSTSKNQRPQKDVLEDLVAAVRGLEHRFDQLELKLASLSSAKNPYVKVVVTDTVGKLRKGRTVNVAVTAQNFVDTIARIAEINPTEFNDSWSLKDTATGRTLEIEDCQNIMAYFNGAEPVIELNDNDRIPF